MIPLTNWAQADMHEDWKVKQDREDKRLRELQELDAAIFDLDRPHPEYWDWPDRLR